MIHAQSLFAASPTPHAGAAAGHAINLVRLGLSLSLLFTVSFMVCIIGYLAFPGLPIDHAALAIFLPGFTLLSWPSFFLGLIESFLWGWYVAVMFGLLYNFFDRRAHH